MGLHLRFDLALLVVLIAGFATAAALGWHLLHHERAFATLLVALGLIFLGFFLVAHCVLGWLVLRPIRRMAATAERISTGDFSEPEFDAAGADEIGVLGQSFNRMRRSLEKAIHMIGVESRW